MARQIYKTESPLVAKRKARDLNHALSILAREAQKAYTFDTSLQSLVNVPFRPKHWINPHAIKGAVEVVARLARRP